MGVRFAHLYALLLLLLFPWVTRCEGEGCDVAVTGGTVSGTGAFASRGRIRTLQTTNRKMSVCSVTYGFSLPVRSMMTFLCRREKILSTCKTVHARTTLSGGNISERKQVRHLTTLQRDVVTRLSGQNLTSIPASGLLTCFLGLGSALTLRIGKAGKNIVLPAASCESGSFSPETTALKRVCSTVGWRRQATTVTTVGRGLGDIATVRNEMSSVASPTRQTTRYFREVAKGSGRGILSRNASRRGKCLLFLNGCCYGLPFSSLLLRPRRRSRLGRACSHREVILRVLRRI